MSSKRNQGTCEQEEHIHHFAAGKFPINQATELAQDIAEQNCSKFKKPKCTCTAVLEQIVHPEGVADLPLRGEVVTATPEET